MVSKCERARRSARQAARPACRCERRGGGGAGFTDGHDYALAGGMESTLVSKLMDLRKGGALVRGKSIKASAGRASGWPRRTHMMMARTVGSAYCSRSLSACEYRSSESPQFTSVPALRPSKSGLAAEGVPEGFGSLKNGSPRGLARCNTRWVRGNRRRYSRARNTRNLRVSS